MPQTHRRGQATQGHAKPLLFSSSHSLEVQLKKTTALSLAQKSISEQSLFSAAEFFTSLKINESTLRDGKQRCRGLLNNGFERLAIKNPMQYAGLAQRKVAEHF